MRWWSLVLVAACGRVGFDAIGDGRGGGDDGSSDEPAQCTSFGPWGTPTRLPDVVQSAGNDWGPAISDDGLMLVFDSGRDSSDLLYVTTRSTTSDAFGAVTQLTSLNIRNEEYGAAWFGHTLYYSSYMLPAGTGGIMFATYLGNGMFDAPQPVPNDFLGTAIEIAQEGRELFYTINPAMSDYRLRHATRPSTSVDWVPDSLLDPFTPAVTVAGWPSYDDARGELYFERTISTAMSEIVVTKRPDLTAPFGPANVVTAIGSDAGDPEISRDGTTLFFSSSRTGTLGLTDLWMVTRACQ